jgi:hypothetical protein
MEINCFFRSAMLFASQRTPIERTGCASFLFVHVSLYLLCGE